MAEGSFIIFEAPFLSGCCHIKAVYCTSLSKSVVSQVNRVYLYSGYCPILAMSSHMRKVARQKDCRRPAGSL